MYAIRSLTVRCLALVALVAAVGGCSSDPKDPFQDTLNAPQKYSDYVPLSARTVASGAGTLTFTAPEAGTVYLLDTSVMSTIEGVQKPKALISGYVTAGSEVVVEPQDRRVKLKGRKGLQLKNMDPSHMHELRFDPSEKKKKA